MLARLEAKAARGVPEAIRAWSPDFMDWRFVAGHAEKLPPRFVAPVGERYSREFQTAGQYAANTWLTEIAGQITRQGSEVAASDAELCKVAADLAEEVRNWLMRADRIAGPVRTAEEAREWMENFAREQGAALPPACKLTLGGLVARMTDAGFWRRQLRRAVARNIEAHAIGLGLVHRRAGLYVSDETVSRRQEQGRRNAKALEETIATNEEKQEFTLAELSALGVSNPRIRRAELMTRIKGFEDFAKGAGHVGMFYTATAPSRMHARLSKSAEPNPKYDGTPPKECAGYLAKVWAKARAWMHRRGIYVYGFRVAEPHHDGTPHWHMLLFMLPAVVESVTYCLRRYFCEADAHELASDTAREARFNAKVIDWERGTAAGYIAKYIAKNIDGQKNDLTGIGEDGEAPECDAKDTAPRVLAWASCWGIRQFQQIGGPGVTIWRELRRIKAMDHQGELFPAWSAADSGNFGRYVEVMGGAAIRRDLRPVQLWSEVLPGKLNRYGEGAAPEVCGVEFYRAEVPKAPAWVKVETRVHQWEIRRKPAGSLSEGADSGRVAGRRASRLPSGFQDTHQRAAKPACLPGRWADNPPASSGMGFDFGAKRPWTRVNNCTPHWWGSDCEQASSARDVDGFELLKPIPRAAAPLPGFEDWQAMLSAARRETMANWIGRRRKAGAWGKFPAPPGGR